MGKYMRKAKTTGDVAVMDVSQSSLGVRTRARTLALQRLQSPPVDDAAPPEEKPELCYLELRSRRLEKPQLQLLDGRKDRRRRCVCKGKEPLESRTGEESGGAACFSCSVEGGGHDLEMQESFGENNLDSEAMERKTRECTPCSSSVRSSTDAATTTTTTITTTAGSSSRQTPPIARNQMVRPNARFVSVPSALELDNFFAFREQSLQQRLREKYNFDFVNDSPLTGRYEWVKVSNP